MWNRIIHQILDITENFIFNKPKLVQEIGEVKRNQNITETAGKIGKPILM